MANDFLEEYNEILSEKFKEQIEEIKTLEKEVEITPRQLLYEFDCERRTKHNNAWINYFLESNLLETIPSYENGWIDGIVTLRHKKKIKSKNSHDPVKRLGILPAANNPPTTITKECSLDKAVTIMMMHNFSQLPVTSGKKSISGMINWETIARGLHKAKPDNTPKVKDFISKEYTILPIETPLLEAIKKIPETGFVLVVKKDQTLSGIVTSTDITEQFESLAEPFLQIEQIENTIRQLLDNKFTLEELQVFLSQEGINRSFEYIDDLNFGDYVRILENPRYWNSLDLLIDKKYFIEKVKKINVIRNEIMHFEPEDISKEQMRDLKEMSSFLMKINP